MRTTNKKPTAMHWHRHRHPRNRRGWMLWPNPIPKVCSITFMFTKLMTTAEAFVCTTRTRCNLVGRASWPISTCTSNHCQMQTWRYTVILTYVTHWQAYQIALALQERITSHPKCGSKFSYNLHYPYSQSC
jgi:hypothetical protein